MRQDITRTGHLLRVATLIGIAVLTVVVHLYR
jgi:hypothetical protein